MKSFHSLASIYFIIISKTRSRIKLLNDHPWKQDGIDPQARNRFSDRLTSSSLIDYGGGEREASLRSAGGREFRAHFLQNRSCPATAPFPDFRSQLPIIDAFFR